MNIMEGSLSNTAEAKESVRVFGDRSRRDSGKFVFDLPLSEMFRELSLRERPESRTLTLGSSFSRPATTIKHLPPNYSEVDSATPGVKLINRSTDNLQALSLSSNPADTLSTSQFSGPYIKEAGNDLPSVDLPIIQSIQEDIPAVPPQNDVPTGQNVDTPSASFSKVFGSRRQAANIESDHESVCLYDVGSWRSGLPITTAETGAPDICWCKQCFQSGCPLDNRICFGTSDGYLEVWTDNSKAPISSSSASLCFCKMLPFSLETVTKYDFYKDDPRKLRDNSSKRKYLLSCRSFYVLSNKDSRFRNVDSGGAQLRSPFVRKSFLQTPPFGHVRQTSAPDTTVLQIGENYQSPSGTNHGIPEIRGQPKSSPGATSLTLDYTPLQSGRSICAKPPVLPMEMCWCGDFCWVTKVRRARTDQSDNRLERRSGTEIGHRVFFSNAGGDIEVWTDLPKPKNAFTGVEKSTCIMAPRHISRVVMFDMYTDSLTQSAPKRMYLLKCREPWNYPVFGSERTGVWDGSAIQQPGVNKDTTGRCGVSALEDCGLHKERGRTTTFGIRTEESPNAQGSGLLQPPQIGHQRRSSAPEALGNKTEPPIPRPKKNHYRLANGKVAIVRMPPGDISCPYI